MLRVLDVQWRKDITEKEKAEIQAQNRDFTQRLNTDGYEYTVQVGMPPMVAIVAMSCNQYYALKSIERDLGADAVKILRLISTILLLINRHAQTSPDANEGTPPVRGNCGDGEGSPTQADQP